MRRVRFVRRVKRIICIFLSLILFLNTGLIPVSGQANVYHKKDSVGKKLALTFDDGPHPRLTPKILDILEKYNVKATFFVIGQNIENYPDAMRRLSESGCEIGNHTFTHKNLRGSTEDGITNEIDRTQAMLYQKYHVTPRLIRPPQGQYSELFSSIAARCDLDIILWSIDTRDWAHTSAQVIANNILSCASEGDIILMHDYVSGYSPTCEALEIFIPIMLERGYQFVTVSELIDS